MGHKKRRKKGKPARGKAAAGDAWRALSTPDLVQALERKLHSDKSREAVEGAKEIVRRGLLDTQRELVQRAYLLRADSLAAAGLFREALDVIGNLLALGFGGLAVAETALRYGIAAGDLPRAQKEIEGARLDAERSSALLADLAVLAPEAGNAAREAPASPALSALAPEADRIRAAFRAYERGDDEETRNVLSAVGRRSPLARWRLLLRGLLASRAGDLAEARAAWERIPSLGACGSLARTLLETLPAPGDAPGAGALGVHEPLGALESPAAGGGDPRLPLLEEVLRAARATGVEEPDDRDEDRLLEATSRLLERWPEGLGRAGRERLFRSILRETALSQASFLTLAADLGQLPEDPLGIRQAAVHFERHDSEQAHRLWIAYLEQFDWVAQLSEEDRNLAQALVWERAGDLALRAARAARSSGCNCRFCRSRRKRSPDVLQPGAADCYRHSARLDPESIEIRRKLAAVHGEMNRSKEAEKALLELVRAFPADAASWRELGELCFKRRAYRKALRHFERARELEPLNRAVRERVVDCQVASAWRRARKGRVRLARADLERAEASLDGVPYPRLALQRAALELAAGDEACADRYIAKAVAAGTGVAEAHLEILSGLGELGASRAARGAAARRLAGYLEALGDGAPGIPQAREALSLYMRLPEVEAQAGDQVFSGMEEKLGRFLEAACALPFSERERLEFCHAFRTREAAKLLLSYARAGRESFPERADFAILEARALLEVEESVPRTLLRLLGRHRDAARARGDQELEMEILEVLSVVATRRRWGRLGAVEGLVPLFLEILAGFGEDEDGGEETEPPRRRRRTRRKGARFPFAQGTFSFDVDAAGGEGGTEPAPDATEQRSGR